MSQPQTYSWFINQPAPPSGGGQPGDAGNFAAGSALGCDPCFLSQQDLLDLLDRILPSSYLDPLKVVGPGYEVFQSYAKLFERASIGVGHLECGQYVLSATGGAYAVASVSFYRANAVAGAVTIKAGTIVSCSVGGQQFVLQQDAVLGPSDLSVGAQVLAVAQGYEYNVKGPSVTAGGEAVAGEIDTIDLPLQDPPYGDPTILVLQLADAAGGVPAMLDALGRDRGIDRLGSEADGPYAQRIRSLPDTVSPAAVSRTIQALFSRYGVTATSLEGWDVRLQTCWDAPAQTYPGPGQAANYDPNLFVWNDPRSPLPNGNRWLSGDVERGAEVITVPAMTPVYDCGGLWNDPATAAPITNSNGQRAVSAWNVPPSYSLGISWCWNGFDAGLATVYKGIWDSLRATVAGGVAVFFELQGQ